MYKWLIIKREIESVFILPFILIGRLISFFFPLNQSYRIFYFFPFHHTGGAEKVHAQIADATGGKDCVIYFTRRSVDQRFLIDFRNTGCDIRDISKYTDNKWLYFMNLIWRGVISGHINKQSSKPIVFNGQSNFGYKLSNWVNSSITQIELIHSLNTFSYIRIPYLSFYKKTVMISRTRVEDHIKLYKKYSIPEEFISRISFLPNRILISPNVTARKKLTNIIFIGRDSPEKRLHIFISVANRMHSKESSLKFTVVGNVSLDLKKKYINIEFAGNINSQEEMENIYQSADVLLLPSLTEGFPLVVMEAMAHGLVVLATPVGDIPYHITDGKNGWLFSSINNEEAIIAEAITSINLLVNEPHLLESISSNNIEHAKNHFQLDDFRKDYNQLFNEITEM